MNNNGKKLFTNQQRPPLFTLEALYKTRVMVFSHSILCDHFTSNIPPHKVQNQLTKMNQIDPQS